jgi:hypothetical protein
MDDRPHRHVPDGQTVPCLDRRELRCDDFLTDRQAPWRDNVPAVPVSVTQQSNMRCAVGIVLDSLNGCRDGLLVTLKVHDAVELFVASTLMASRDPPLIIAACLFALLLDELW